MIARHRRAHDVTLLSVRSRTANVTAPGMPSGKDKLALAVRAVNAGMEEEASRLAVLYIAETRPSHYREVLEWYWQAVDEEGTLEPVAGRLGRIRKWVTMYMG